MMQLTQFSPMPVSILLTVSLLHGPFRMISTQLDTMLRLLPIPQVLPSGSMLPSWTLVTLLSTTLSFTSKYNHTITFYSTFFFYRMCDFSNIYSQFK